MTVNQEYKSILEISKYQSELSKKLDVMTYIDVSSVVSQFLGNLHYRFCR